MQKKYIFLPLKEIEDLTDDYLAHDNHCKMQIRNGMTREIAINSHILSEFQNQNNLISDDESLTPNKDKLLKHAKICCEHYQVATPEQLVEDYLGYHDETFLDEKDKIRYRKRMEKMKKLLAS